MRSSPLRDGPAKAAAAAKPGGLGPPQPATVLAYLALIGLTFATTFYPTELFSALAAGVFLLIIALEARRIPLVQLLLCGTLVAIGVGCALTAAEPLKVILEGVRRAQFFILLFAAVACLRYPAQASPSVLAVRHSLADHSAKRRFITVSLVVHVVGSVLSLLAVSLFTEAVRDQKTDAEKRRFLRALLGGFLCASCWSPYFLSMTVIHIVYPDMAWLSVLPLGLAIAAVLILANWAVECYLTRGEPAGAQGRTGWMTAAQARLFGLVLGMTVAAIALIEVAELPVAVAIAFLAPPVGLAWTLAIAASRRARPAAATAPGYLRSSLQALPTLRNETLLFLGANVMATGIAVAVPENLLSEIFLAFAPSTALKISAVTAAMCLLGLIGLHPVVITILVAQVASAEQLGIAPEVMAVLLLAMWGVTTALSPFSAVTLFASRMAEVSPWKLAWRWNLPMALAAAIIVTGAAIALSAIFPT